MKRELSRSSIRYGAAALAASAALVAAGCGGSGTQTANGPNKAPISLPNRLAGLEDYLTAVRRGGSGAGIAAQQRLVRDAERLTTAAYSRAYGGAAVATRTYTDASLQNSLTVIAVRAHSPGLTMGPVSNPADSGLAVNVWEVHSFGDVACVVNDLYGTPAGSRVDPSNLYYPQCQRTGPHLTVSVFGGNLKGDTGRRDAVALTDGAYRAMAAQSPVASSIPPTGSSTEPISLPNRLDGFENAVTVIQRHTANAAAVASQRRIYGDAERLTVAAYSRAYGGAAAAYRGYRDASTESDVSVIAVRAPSPGLTAGVLTNPADPGSTVVGPEVQVFGDVACVVRTINAVAAGSPAATTVNPSNLYYPQCQRTGPHLTVSVFSNLKGDAGRRDAVALTDNAYRAVAGG